MRGVSGILVAEELISKSNKVEIRYRQGQYRKMGGKALKSNNECGILRRYKLIGCVWEYGYIMLQIINRVTVNSFAKTIKCQK